MSRAGRKMIARIQCRARSTQSNAVYREDAEEARNGKYLVLVVHYSPLPLLFFQSKHHRPQCAAFLQGQEVVHLEYHSRVIVSKCVHKLYARLQAAAIIAATFNQLNMLAYSNGREYKRHNRSERGKNKHNKGSPRLFTECTSPGLKI